MTMSPGATSAWTTILLLVEVPLVTKNTWSAPKARAAISCAFLMLPGRLQKAVEAARRGAAFGEEQIDAVELAHVANPLRPEHRFAACDRQGVKGADGALRISLEVVEEGRLETRLDPLENGEMQFEKFLYGVENPPGAGCGGIGCERLHFAVGRDVDVEIRSDAFQDAGKFQCGGIGRQLADRIVYDAAQGRRFVLRPERHALGHDDREDLRIDDGSAERVFETADDDRLVDERILDAPKTAHLGAYRRATARRAAG